MSVLASALTGLVQAELQDAAKRRWTDALLLTYLNDAQRAVVLARPDANAITESVLLAAGTKQSLPAGGLRLLDVSRNMGAGGVTAGDSIILSSREDADRYKRSWNSATAVTTVDEVFYDYKRDPLVYWVSQPITGTWYIEICYSKSPTDVAAIASAIGLSDVYAPALNEWMLYRSFSINSAPGSQARAAAHLATFGNLLGVKMKIESFVQPVPAATP